MEMDEIYSNDGYTYRLKKLTKYRKCELQRD